MSHPSGSGLHSPFTKYSHSPYYNIGIEEGNASFSNNNNGQNDSAMENSGHNLSVRSNARVEHSSPIQVPHSPGIQVRCHVSSSPTMKVGSGGNRGSYGFPLSPNSSATHYPVDGNRHANNGPFEEGYGSALPGTSAPIRIGGTYKNNPYGYASPIPAGQSAPNHTSFIQSTLNPCNNNNNNRFHYGSPHSPLSGERSFGMSGQPPSANYDNSNNSNSNNSFRNTKKSSFRNNGAMAGVGSAGPYGPGSAPVGRTFLSHASPPSTPHQPQSNVNFGGGSTPHRAGSYTSRTFANMEESKNSSFISCSSGSSGKEELPLCEQDDKCPLINDRKHQRQFAHTCRLFPCYHSSMASHAKMFRHAPGQLTGAEGVQNLTPQALTSVNFTSISPDAPNAYLLYITFGNRSCGVSGDWANVKVHTLKRYLNLVFHVAPAAQQLRVLKTDKIMDDELSTVKSYGVEADNIIELTNTSVGDKP